MAVLKSRWKKKGTGDIIHPETEVDQIMNGSNALNAVISTLLKAASSSAARSAIEAAAASHSHASGDITSFATSVINAIGTETLSALGVRYSITTNGYICFGDLFGGLILQWKYATLDSNAETEFPITYPNMQLSAALSTVSMFDYWYPITTVNAKYKFTTATNIKNYSILFISIGY